MLVLCCVCLRLINIVVVVVVVVVNEGIYSTQYAILTSSSADHKRLLMTCLEMFNCLQAEQTIAIRKREFLNKFSVINNVLCQVSVVNAKKELESCSTDV